MLLFSFATIEKKVVLSCDLTTMNLEPAMVQRPRKFYLFESNLSKRQQAARDLALPEVVVRSLGL